MRLPREAEGLELRAEEGEKPPRPGRLSPEWVERGKRRGDRVREPKLDQLHPAGSGPAELPWRNSWRVPVELGCRARRGVEQSFRPSPAKVGTERPRGPVPGFLYIQEAWASRPPRSHKSLPGWAEPRKARAFSESERSGAGGAAGGGPSRLRRELRLGAVSSPGRQASPVPAAPRAGGLRRGSVTGK